MKALLDTHMLIDYLRGKAEAKRELTQYEAPLISAVTVAEIMGLAEAHEREAIAAFLKGFEIIPCDATVATLAAEMKARHDLSMEAAIIWASAKAQGALFVTRNKASYPPHEAGIRHPY